MKKFILLIILLVATVGITGCGDNNLDPLKDLENYNNDNNDNNNNNDDDFNINLYSDDTKLVYDFSGIYKIVYYYSGDTITGLEYYYDYESAEMANIAIAGIKSTYSSEDNIKSIDRKGSVIIIKFKEEEFEDLTVEEVKRTYSFLKEVQENS